jgi:DENN (AEX-3) domain
VFIIHVILKEFQLFGTVMTLPSLSTVGRHPVDYNSGLVLQFLDAQTILFVFTALLVQQRIVFLSSSYALLVLVSEVSISNHFLIMREVRTGDHYGRIRVLIK